ncbi:MAG TPA: questin oxidase family protein [Myxococcota bacterium]|nr:questin oxidase family protein [Myxococcota bacterium]
MKPDYDSLDETLRDLAAYGPDLANGNTNHAPMAVEALCALGRADAAPAWLARYRAQLLPMPERRERITQASWRSALARTERAGDWSDFFREELANEPWRAVLDRWVGRLAPALCASAAHGVIRVGHAARALAHGESPERVRELADALASWAFAWQVLPTSTAPAAKAYPAAEALAHVPVAPPERRVFKGSIVSALEGLDQFPEFAPAIDLLALGPDPAAQLAELTEVFARVYVANAHDVLTCIVFVHGVTSVTALGHLLPFLSPAHQRAGMRFAWQTGAALYAAFGKSAPAREIEPPRESLEVLAERAVAHGDEHAIKLAEACLARNAIRPHPAYSAAVASALRLLPRAT